MFFSPPNLRLKISEFTKKGFFPSLGFIGEPALIKNRHFLRVGILYLKSTRPIIFKMATWEPL